MKLLFPDGYEMTSVWHSPGFVAVSDSYGETLILSLADWKTRRELALANGASRA